MKLTLIEKRYLARNRIRALKHAGFPICKRWATNPLTMIEDIDIKPNGWYLRRIDKDKPFSKTNVIWHEVGSKPRTGVWTKQQYYVVINGCYVILRDLSEMLGLSAGWGCSLLNRGKRSIIDTLKYNGLEKHFQTVVSKLRKEDHPKSRVLNGVKVTLTQVGLKSN